MQLLSYNLNHIVTLQQASEGGMRFSPFWWYSFAAGSSFPIFSFVIFTLAEKVETARRCGESVVAM